MTRSSLRFALLSVSAATLLFSACSSSSSDSESVRFDDDDVMFAQMMIPHHEQAIELSDIALDPAVGAGQDIRDLATAIKDAQDPEIDQMTSLLTEWGQPLTADPNMDHGSMMSGMLSVDELESLGALTSAEFDRAWLGAMIAHHEGAVDMAQDVLESGVNPDIETLATDVVATQSSEISTMTALLDD